MYALFERAHISSAPAHQTTHRSQYCSLRHWGKQAHRTPRRFPNRLWIKNFETCTFNGNGWPEKKSIGFMRTVKRRPVLRSGFWSMSYQLHWFGYWVNIALTYNSPHVCDDQNEWLIFLPTSRTKIIAKQLFGWRASGGQNGNGKKKCTQNLYLSALSTCHCFSVIISDDTRQPHKWQFRQHTHRSYNIHIHNTHTRIKYTMHICYIFFFSSTSMTFSHTHTIVTRDVCSFLSEFNASGPHSHVCPPQFTQHPIHRSSFDGISNWTAKSIISRCRCHAHTTSVLHLTRVSIYTTYLFLPRHVYSCRPVYLAAANARVRIACHDTFACWSRLRLRASFSTQRNEHNSRVCMSPNTKCLREFSSLMRFLYSLFGPVLEHQREFTTEMGDTVNTTKRREMNDCVVSMNVRLFFHRFPRIFYYFPFSVHIEMGHDVGIYVAVAVLKHTRHTFDTETNES